MEITGNKFAREAFNELGIQKNSRIYEYDSPAIQKYKNELASKVKELLDMEDLKNGKLNINSNNGNSNNNLNNSNANNNKDSRTNGNTNNISNEGQNKNGATSQVENINSKKEKKEEEIPKFTDFKIEANDNSIKKKPEAKISKTSKIKKVDFDFDFESFNDINFSNFENSNQNTNTVQENNKKEDPFACFDGNKNEENNNNSNISYLNNNNNSNENYLSKNDNIVITEKVRQEADKKFANKKAVGWEDYANL